MTEAFSLTPDVVPLSDRLTSMPMLLAVAQALIGPAHLTEAEFQAARQASGSQQDERLVAQLGAAIESGLDPLGDAYCALNAPAGRRGQGQTFTPEKVIDGMLGWARRQGRVDRLVDPGAGSGRYTLAGLQAFPEATAVAVERDPAVALILRANLAAAGLADRCQVIVDDFRRLELDRIAGTTLRIGNPPYVRHHDIAPAWKAWYSDALARLGLQGSQLAGLHLHFFVKTLELASEGDLGCYVTAAEWLDAKYGQALRQLLTGGLGATEVFVVEPTVQVFGDALVSAAITCSKPGSKPAVIGFAAVAADAELRRLDAGAAIDVAVARSEPKWSFLIRGGRTERRAGFIELGELFKVSRGQVTGLNRVWVQGGDTPDLPGRFLLPAITGSTDTTRAARGVIDDERALRRLICLPPGLDNLEGVEKTAVDRFLDWARGFGAHETYIARHRNPWWSVGAKKPAPIVMTYMGRRPPAFAVNQAGAQLINVAHGLYPRRPFSQTQLRRLVDWLNENVDSQEGRTYAGGLVKFEPSGAMRIPVPAALAS